MNREEALLIWGRKPVLELLKNKPSAIIKIAKLADVGSVIETELVRHKLRTQIFEKQDLDDLVESNQGIVAYVTPSNARGLDEIISKSLKHNRPIVLLDQIKDPANLGSIFRVSDALGVAGIVMTKDNSVQVTSLTRRISISATEFVPYCIETNLVRVIERLKKEGIWVVGTSLGEKAKSIAEIDLNGNFAFVFGSEEKGLRRLVEEKCDIIAQIPMRGVIESLNVSHAMAIVLYESMIAKIKK